MAGGWLLPLSCLAVSLLPAALGTIGGEGEALGRLDVPVFMRLCSQPCPGAGNGELLGCRGTLRGRSPFPPQGLKVDL